MMFSVGAGTYLAIRTYIFKRRIKTRICVHKILTRTNFFKVCSFFFLFTGYEVALCLMTVLQVGFMKTGFLVACTWYSVTFKESLFWSCENPFKVSIYRTFFCIDCRINPSSVTRIISVGNLISNIRNSEKHVSVALVRKNIKMLCGRIIMDWLTLIFTEKGTTTSTLGTFQFCSLFHNIRYWFFHSFTVFWFITGHYHWTFPGRIRVDWPGARQWGVTGRKEKINLLSTQISKILTVNTTLYNNLMIKISKTSLLITLDFVLNAQYFNWKSVFFIMFYIYFIVRLILKGFYFLTTPNIQSHGAHTPG